MSESTLTSLMQLLAFIAARRDQADVSLEKNIVMSFLQKQFDKDVTEKYAANFVKYFNQNISKKGVDSSFDIDLHVQNLTEEIHKNLPFKQRIYLVVSLIEFSNYFKIYTNEDELYQAYFPIVIKIARLLRISNEVYDNLYYFIDNKYFKIQQSNLLALASKDEQYLSGINIQQVQGLKGIVYILNLNQSFFLLKYHGEDKLYIDDDFVQRNNIYFFSRASNLKISKTKSVFFSDIDKFFIRNKCESRLNIVANQIEFRYKNSDHGIHSFNFECSDGELVGILGSSGTGKTTLLNLLNGVIHPHKGGIYINGHESTPQNTKLRNLIGYVPQDDLLLSELTVFENLYFRAKLCLANLDEEALNKKLRENLELLGIYDIKDLKVGNELQKIISGGQRKRLNMALELILEPVILFLDEPTSGLSSNDSKKIIDILKYQTSLGKICVVNIHQPSDYVFYSFDQIIVLDQGGYPVYYGKPGNAINYFQKASHTINYQTLDNKFSEPEQILARLEETIIDDKGIYTNTRKVKPKEWYQLFLRETQNKNLELPEKIPLPKSQTEIPSAVAQFKTYLNRTIKSKFIDKQYMILSLGIAPVLAFILSFLCRDISYLDGSPVYKFSDNNNIPSFIFMSTIVAIFIGLIISAEEIIRDRRMLLRESFLNLSKRSYYMAKVIQLFVLSVVQVFSYAIISYTVLKLSGNYWAFTLTLLCSALLANILGLLISTVFRTVVAVYIMIPLILVPQILLSGMVVRFDNLHHWVASDKYVPIIGEVMPARWSFEALMVDQYKNNDFQKEIYELEQKESTIAYHLFVQIPYLTDVLNDLHLKNTFENDVAKDKFILLRNEFAHLNALNEFDYIEKLVPEHFNKQIYKSAIQYLNNLKQNLNASYNKTQIAKDAITEQLIANSSNGNLDIKAQEFNKSVANMVLNKNSSKIIGKSKHELVRKIEPIYYYPENKFGRAHFFAPVKRIGNINIDTIIFNNLIILGMTLVLLLVLLKDWQFLLFRSNKIK